MVPFLSTLSLRRATRVLVPSVLPKSFLSTLSLRRATNGFLFRLFSQNHFYPRSPCGERLQRPAFSSPCRRISIHALLAESDSGRCQPHFAQDVFLSTLSLRRATKIAEACSCTMDISIHALLAESDFASDNMDDMAAKFLSTLSLRRATGKMVQFTHCFPYFYPRSPCGERRAPSGATLKILLFLSTLSLRRATHQPVVQRQPGADFYPRSPCGERRKPARDGRQQHHISIHALLAESDAGAWLYLIRAMLFLSTLSLRRATPARGDKNKSGLISIHALLAESDNPLPGVWELQR